MNNISFPKATLSNCTSIQVRDYALCCLYEAYTAVHILGIRSVYQNSEDTMKKINKLIREIEGR